MTGSREESALGAAQERFVEALPRRIVELRALLERYLAGPGHPGDRAELLRRLGALHASAQVFRFTDLAASLANGLSALSPDEDAEDAEEAPEAAADAPEADEPARFEALLVELDAFARVHGAPRISAVGPADDPRADSIDAAATVVGLAGAETPALGRRREPSASGDSGAPTPVRIVASPSSRPPARVHPASSVDTVVSILVIGTDASRLASGLPNERFELQHADLADALEAARVGVPDIVLVSETALASAGRDLVASLRADSRTDLVPILLVVSDAASSEGKARRYGVDDVVVITADPISLAGKIARLSGLLPVSRMPELGTLTLREVADRMADELRRGLLDSAERGSDEPIALGDGTELFAAVWASIARMRTTLVDRSSGKVRFHDSDRRGGRGWLTVGNTQARADASTEVPLQGRRILVADDDPAVRWFFLGLLQDAGAHVIEAPDGRAALELARKLSPDLVITDILMPHLDGLSLSRELARDPLLSETPVIFLSWKEDYLQRMRELRAGAAAYLLKEEGAAVILDRVRETFRPRVRFEARLSEPGDVRGRVEGFGVLSILRSVARIRRDARVTFRDVYNLFEVDVRAGRFVAVVRTATDGSFARGERALAPLLGVTAGRFAVLPPVASEKPTVSPIGPEQIEREASRLGALVDAVSGRGLALADDVELDADVVASLMPVSPPPIVDVVRRLRLDRSARRWLASGDIEPEVLESALVELARRGAIVAVLGSDGEDRVAEALTRRSSSHVETPAPRPDTDTSRADVSGSERRPASQPPGPTRVIGEIEIAEIVAEERNLTGVTRSNPSGRVTRPTRKRREGMDETLRVQRDEPAPTAEASSVGLWVIVGVTAIAALMIAIGFLASGAPTQLPDDPGGTAAPTQSAQ